MSSILLLEDDPGTASFMTLMLEDEGHEVRVVSTLAAGLAALRSGPPDLTITDLSLPASPADGELIRQLRQTAPEVPILVCTASLAIRGETPQSLRVDGILPKPFELDTLLQTVRDLGRRPRGPTG